MDLIHHLDIHPRLADHRCSAARGVQRKPKLLELLGNLRNLRLIGIADGHQNAAGLFHLVARCDQSFIQRFLHGVGNAQHLAGGFHFRPQVRVHIHQLFRRKDRHLHRHIRGNGGQIRPIPHFAQLFAQHRARG